MEQTLSRAEAAVHADRPPTCFICLCADEDLLRGCACRGGAGFAHLACLVAAAQANAETWTRCPTCKQDWTGAVELGLSSARVELAARLPEGDGDAEKLMGDLRLSQAMANSGKYNEALELGRRTLVAARRMTGAESRYTLLAMANLANVHTQLGDTTAALPLLQEGLLTRRRLYGDDAEDTISSMTNLGMVHKKIGNHAAALSLYEEALQRSRRILGKDHVGTMATMGNLAVLYQEMGQHNLALSLQTEALALKRRVLGSLNPSTLLAMANLGMEHIHLGNLDAALPLLEEAVAGFTAECGHNHPDTQLYKDQLDHLRQVLSDPQLVRDHQREVRLRAQEQQAISAAKARGTLVGLIAKPELNGMAAHVVGYDAAKDRYRVRLYGSGTTERPLGIKPANIILDPGTAVVVEGLSGSPEWNGKLGVIKDFDEEKRRYQLQMEGRTKPLGVRAERCKLEFAVEEKHTRERDAQARKSGPESEL